MADTPEPYDATDPAAEANAKRDEARKAREDADVLRSIMMKKTGRAWMHRLLSRCHIYSSPFAPGQADVTAYALGEENIGKQLMLAVMTVSSELYVKMMDEQRAEEDRLNEVRRREERNRQREDDDIGVRMQGFDLPAPGTEPKPLA